MSWNGLHYKTGAELATAFAAIPEHIRELTISWSDFSTLTPEEIVFIGKALPHVMTIHVVGSPTHHPSLDTLKQHIGGHIRVTYRALVEDNPIESTEPTGHECYSFQWNYLHALAAVSAIILLAGIVALCWSSQVALGVGLTVVGGAGLLLATHGLFKNTTTNGDGMPHEEDEIPAADGPS